jgi:hypothetical protein
MLSFGQRSCFTYLSKAMNTRAVPDDFDAEAGAGNVLGLRGDFDFFFAVADAGDVGLGVLVLGFAEFAL